MKENAPKIDVTNVPVENQQVFVEHAKIAKESAEIIDKSRKEIKRAQKIEDAGKFVKLGGYATGAALVGVLPPAAIPIGAASFLTGAYIEAKGSVEKEFALKHEKQAQHAKGEALRQSRKLTSKEPDIETARTEMEKVLETK